MTPTVIDLNEYLTPGAKIFTGRDRGQVVRERSRIDELFAKSSKVRVVLPEQIRTINPSFLEEFLVNVVLKYGREGFLSRVEFTRAQRYNISVDLDEAIDRILTEENALTV